MHVLRRTKFRLSSSNCQLELREGFRLVLWLRILQGFGSLHIWFSARQLFHSWAAASLYEYRARESLHSTTFSLGTRTKRFSDCVIPAANVSIMR